MSGLSRASLIATLALAAWSFAAPAIDPHMDAGLLPGQCQACHAGHGESGSPMLPASQAEVCLSCHGSESDRNRMIARGLLAPSARPQLMAPTRDQAFVHPITEGTFSRYESGAVTCTSCHSPHRGMRGRVAGDRRLGGRGVVGSRGVAPTGTRKPSPRDPVRFEYEMCGNCHGGDDTPRGGLDAGDLFDPSNRSYHPVEAPATSTSPSVQTDYQGNEINCTDCHGNDDRRVGVHAQASTEVVAEVQRHRPRPIEPKAAIGMASRMQCEDCRRQEIIHSKPIGRRGR